MSELTPDVRAKLERIHTTAKEAYQCLSAENLSAERRSEMYAHLASLQRQMLWFLPLPLVGNHPQLLLPVQIATAPLTHRQQPLGGGNLSQGART